MVGRRRGANTQRQRARPMLRARWPSSTCAGLAAPAIRSRLFRFGADASQVVDHVPHLLVGHLAFEGLHFLLGPSPSRSTTKISPSLDPVLHSGSVTLGGLVPFRPLCPLPFAL